MGKKRLAVLVGCVAAMVATIALAATTYAQPGVTVARGGECISELAVAVGSDGAAQLEKDGFTVMNRPLCDGGEAYVAYKRGGTPITGVAASAGSGGLSVDGVGYGLVSGADLCAGVKGQTYLYATNDGASGPGVVSIAVDSSEGAVDDAPLALRNDGTSPLRDESGRPVDFGAGAPAYAFVLREGVVRPYVSDLRAVSGADLRGAVLEAAAAGFDYYYDPGLATPEGSYVVIGYSRTADANAAVTCVTARPAGERAFEAGGVAFERKGDVVLAEAVPYVLFATRDHAAGNPILDFTGSGVPVRATDVLGKWAERTFVKFASAAPAQQAQTEPLYGDLMKSKSGLASVAVLMASAEPAQAVEDASKSQEVQSVQNDGSAQQERTHGAVVEGEAGGVVTSLAYVCVAADLPASIFGKAATASRQEANPANELTTQQQGGAASESTASSTEQRVTSETREAKQNESTAEDAQASEYVDDFDQANYLSAQPEVIALGDSSEGLAASVFGKAGVAGTLTVMCCMAAVGAVVGFIAYTILKRKREANGEEQS